MSRSAPLLALLASAALVLAEPARPFQATAADRHKVRVASPATARILKDQGAALVASYEGFQVFEVNAQALRTLAADPGLERVDDWFRIHLNTGALDTRAESHTPARATVAAATGGRRLHLVQFVGPIQPGWREELEADGWQVVCYVPENAYVVYGDSAARQRLAGQRAARPQVQWEGALLDDEKIQPRARPFDAAGQPRPVDQDAYIIQMVLDPAANAATLRLIEALQLAPAQARNEWPPYLNVIVRLPATAVANLAAQPDVLSIQAYVEPRLMCERQGMIVSGHLTGNVPSGPGYLNWLYSKGFTQSQFTAAGFAVDVTDSGIGNGTTNENHFGLRLLGDLSQVSRVAYSRVVGTGGASGGQGCDGHGNLNAHIIGGYNVSNGFPHADGAGYHYGLGICPFVRVGASVIFDPNYTNPDYENLISLAYQSGARISSDSWGANVGGDYDVACQQYDALVRDAQPTGSSAPAAGNQEMTIVFAAGNAGPGASTVGSPGGAKNVITVGAAENVQAFGGADGSGITDTGADNAYDMISFSSRGPCQDGRRKPDIVAPGTHVSGGVAQQTATAGGTGNAIPCFDGSGVSGGSGGSSFFPNTGQEFFSASSGTSHSTPGVAGGCALVRQWFVNTGLNVPSPAMVKAFLANSTRYMNGVGANDTLPSNNQGMGGMQLGRAFDGGARILRDQLTNDLFTASGQSRIFTARVVSNSAPVRITLAWTDAPGSTVGNAYNNNLDLVVTLNGVTYRGNVFAGANSTAGGTADVRNNMESVFLPAGTTGTLAITVSATSINSDGIPNFGGGLDQDFALVGYNIEAVSLPLVVGSGWALTAESCGLTGNGSIDPLEQVTVRLALRNIGSAPTTNVMGTLLAINGVTAPSAPQSYGALTVGGNPVTNSFTFIATGTCGGVVSATLQLTDGATALGTAIYTLPIGTNNLYGRTNSNPASIVIPNVGNATPYPSTINVSGASGVITKVTATLLGFAHTWPDDVDVLLAGPGGQGVILMAACGGATDVTGLQLTFDDSAAAALPNDTTLGTGTYLPTDNSGGTAAFGAPAPAGPYGTALSAFNGLSANGNWSLYVLDAAGGDQGSIAQGWRLNLTLGTPLCCLSNQPPVLDPIGNRSVFHSNSLQFAVSATDPSDGHFVTLTASNVPGGAQFYPTNGVNARGSFYWPTATNPPGDYVVTFYATDVNGSVSEAVTLTVLPAGVEGCGLIISEYLHSNTVSMVELYNGTGSPIDLAASNTVLSIYKDGAGTTTNHLYLTGYLPANETYLVVSSTAGTNLKAQAQQVTNLLEVANGNDPLVLRMGGLGGKIQDSIGDVGGGALQSWGSYTTLVRKASVSSGDTLTTDPFTPSFWLGFPRGTYTNIGTHKMTCLGGVQGPPILLPVGNQVVMLSNSLSLALEALPTDSDTVTLSVSNPPPGALFGSTNELGAFHWAVAAPLGVYTTRFAATDNDGVSSELITITVVPYVEPPTNVLVWYAFEDAGAAFTRAPSQVTAGVVPSHFDSASAASSEQSGNPLSALGSSGFTGAGDNYFTFSLHITAGRTLNVARVLFEDLASLSGPATWSLRSSADGFASSLAAGGTHTTFGTNEVGLALSGLTGLHTFRLYGAGAFSAGGTWKVDNFRLLGTFAGTGLTPAQPGLVITTATQVVRNDVTALPFGGVATPPVTGHLRWTNTLNGTAGTLAAATNWLTAALPLAEGANLITVSGSNGATVVSDTRVITRLAAPRAAGPAQVLFQGFEPGDGWSIAAGAGAISTDPGASDFPPDQRIRSGTHAWQVNSQNVTLQLIQASLAGYTGRQLAVRLASPALAAGEGVESADVVRVQVALNGAAFAAWDAAEFAARGDRNARWGFWATNRADGAPALACPLPAPQPGTDSNNFAQMFLPLPDSATSIALRVWAGTDGAQELWSVDDIEVTGHPTTNDSDNDGLDDAWENANFGGLGTAGTGTDSDGDGFSDWAEFLAGTEATNANSLLEAVTVTNAPAGWLLRWSSVTEKLYRISRASQLPASFEGIASNLPGTPPFNTYTDAVSTNVLRLYRVEAQ